jgi:hypothetical protein
MLAVEHYELIRRKVVIEGKSQRDVAKELGHSSKTIAKALELRIPPGYRLSKLRPSPVKVGYMLHGISTANIQTITLTHDLNV